MTKPMRPCLDCGALSPSTRCEEHTKANRAKYGSRHQRNRAAWAAIVATGKVTCWRCRRPIEPGTDWDLGHRPGKPSHPEHANECNRSSAAAYRDVLPDHFTNPT